MCRANSSLKVIVVSKHTKRAQELGGLLETLGWQVEVYPGDVAVALRCRGEITVLHCNRYGRRFLFGIHQFRQECQGSLIVVGQDASDADAAQVIEAGADDFIAEPVSDRLFLARCGSVERRRVQPKSLPYDKTLKVGPISLDIVRSEVMVVSRRIALTRSQFRILERLAQTPDVPVTDQELIVRVLGNVFRPGTSIARFHIHHLRERLGVAGLLIECRRPRSYCLAAAMGENH